MKKCTICWFILYNLTIYRVVFFNYFYIIAVSIDVNFDIFLIVGRPNWNYTALNISLNDSLTKNNTLMENRYLLSKTLFSLLFSLFFIFYRL